jgi:hypothetical protein
VAKYATKISILKYNWESLQFWVIRKIIRLEQKTKQQKETIVSEDIMDFLHDVVKCLLEQGADMKAGGMNNEKLLLRQLKVEILIWSNIL